MADPYVTLGVDRNADEAAIKRAYRKLAKELHPDRNAHDPRAAERFKRVTAAYDLLSDKAKRAAYDRGEIDGDGNPRMPRGFDGFARAGSRPGGFRPPPPGDSASFEADFGDILSELFGGVRGGRTGPRPAAKGPDVAYRLAVSFADAALARPQRITLRSGRTVDVKLPPGVEDGQQLRLAGQGEPGPAGAGDAIVTIVIQPDARFERSGDDVRTDLAVPLANAVLGGKVRAPTLEGDVMLAIAPGTSSGKVMRLKGKGWTRRDGTRGDLLARVMVEVPVGDAALEKLFRERQTGQG
ncbi:DnaJ C-terminal domain-containing protein [Thermaurantiacus sp.]